MAQLSAVEMRRQVALRRRRRTWPSSRAGGCWTPTCERGTSLAPTSSWRARQRELGAGSRLNELRAEQSLSSDEALIEQAALDVSRAEEALGVLIAADGPATAADEPTLETPVDLRAAVSQALPGQAGCAGGCSSRARRRPRPERHLEGVAAIGHRAFSAAMGPTRERLPAGRVVAGPDHREHRHLRCREIARGRRAERQALLEQAQSARTGVERQAQSEVRTAEESIRRATAALASARAAAQQALEVVNIVNVSFQAGASTNIEVIDAQRAARDADTAAAVAEVSTATGEAGNSWWPWACSPGKSRPLITELQLQSARATK